MTPEAQNQIDYMVKKYQETIQKFDQSEVVNREIEKENKNLKSLVKALESKFDSLAGDVSRLAQTLASSVEMQQGKNEANSILNLKFQDSLSALRKDLSDSITESVKTNTKLDGSLSLIEGLSRRVESVEKGESELFHSVVKLKEHLVFCMDEFSKHDNLIKENKSSIIELNLLADKNSQDSSTLSQQFKSYATVQAGLIDALDLKISSSSASLVKQIDQKIAEIPKPVIPDHEAVKQDLEKQLAPVILDAKNAYIRSTNTEARMNLADKRIEQVNLLLKKLELQA